MIRIGISSESDVTRSVIEASRICRAKGFSQRGAQAVATAVSELARNILKYAATGDIFLEDVVSADLVGVVVVARDQGPGIADIDAAMQDHYSSGGTLGLGLPGVRRMMDEFKIESVPDRGTEVTILKWKEPPHRRTHHLAGAPAGEASPVATREVDRDPAPARIDAAAVVRPCRGERVSGDVAIIDEREDAVLVAVVDALGHGPEANQVAQRAEGVLRQSWTSDVAGLLTHLHEVLRGSLGAAAGLAVLDRASGVVRFSGVGNVVARSFGPRESRLFCTAGTLGHQIRTPQEQRMRLSEKDVLVLYSDGVRERFEVADYPQISYQGAGTIARTIVDRFGKHHDDASCVALRYRR